MSDGMGSTSLRMRYAGLVLGPLCGVLAYFALPQAQLDEAGRVAAGLTGAGRATVGAAAWMAIWWLTEAIPLSATSLLPLVLFPAAGIASMKAACAPYANEVIFLFLGGFILGLALERCGLHRRVALATLLVVGGGPRLIILGMMTAAAGISLWVNNTSTTMMMLPIAMSVIALVGRESGGGEGDRNFEAALLLGVAYASSIGGVATLIGTAPNGIMKGFVGESLGREIGFLNWMYLGVPLVVVFLPLAWWFMTSVALPVRLRGLPGGRGLFRKELRELGPMSRGEWIVLGVFATTVGLWLVRPLIEHWGKGTPLASVSDASIAIFGALLLFVIPVRAREGVFAMDWQTAERLPWGALLLFGGGLSLAAAVTANGVDQYIGRQLQGLGTLPAWGAVLLVCTVVVFLSELASNTALTSALLPVVAAAAPAMGVDPMVLIVTVTVAASWAFMMPVGTPPNAIVYATGKVTMGQMARTGLGLNVIGIVVVTVGVLVLGGVVAR